MKPIVSREVNYGGQVDLVDMQLSQQGQFVDNGLTMLPNKVCNPQGFVIRESC